MSSSRNQWKRGRERDRRKARFMIRERVEVGCESVASDSFSEDQMNEVLGKIHAGHRSFFSLSKLAELEVSSKRMPTDVLLSNLPRENVVSRLGSSHLLKVEAYLQSHISIPIMEYVILLGRYHILGALLVGGVSPCVRGIQKETRTSPEWDEELQRMANPLLRRFFDCFPISLSSYIVKRVVDMRVHSILIFSQKRQSTIVCGICQKEVPSNSSLIYTKDFDGKEPCCSFCEVCFWQDVLARIDERTDGDTVPCPCCSFRQDGAKNDNAYNGDTLEEKLGPKARYQKSLKLFQSLPVDSKALKESGRRKKKVSELEALTSHWTQAVLPSLGLCQSVRSDKLFKFTTSGSPSSLPYVKGCLEAGVDVNATNEYGQSVLYLASWNGSLALVDLFLSYGANPFLCANGMNMTLDRVCSENCHLDCLDKINFFRREHWSSDEVQGENSTLVCPKLIMQSGNTEIPALEMLISPNIDHPGAGSYLITNCIQDVQPLVDLWGCLPIDTTSPKKEKKGETCADRAYFCDSEGWIRNALRKRILEAFQTRDAGVGDVQDVIVLSNMRFLHYAHAGSALAPHIDLNRMDPQSGLKSTHSFLLYLTTCEKGGETILLEAVASEGRNVALARVKPVRSSLLLFPHECPHEGNSTESVPKLLIRGEIVLLGANSEPQQ